MAADLNTNSTYTLITRYNIDSATTTLWLNPVSESSFGVTPNDVASNASISSYGFCQDYGVGANILISDFKVRVSFAAVTSSNLQTISPIPLNLQRSGNNLVLSWSNPSFALQSASVVTGLYANVPSAASPYTNPITASPKFFRLKAN